VGRQIGGQNDPIMTARGSGTNQFSEEGFATFTRKVSDHLDIKRMEGVGDDLIAEPIVQSWS
jgi:hypothetical protein